MSFLGRPIAHALLLVSLNIGCSCTSPRNTDAGPDAGDEPDAPIAIDARDAPISPDAPALTWSIEEATAAFCEPLATAECEAITACPCAIERACDPVALAARCREVLEARVVDGRTIDGRYLGVLRAQREAAFGACLPIAARTFGIAFDVPEAAFVQPIPLAGRCLPTGNEACAGGDGLCIAARCSPRAHRRTVCDPTIVDHCQPGLRCVGTCVPLGAEGADCDDDAGGAVCEPDLVCVSGRCARLGAPGATCDEDRPCAPCARCDEGACTVATSCTRVGDDECGFGANCNVGTCRALITLGESCELLSCEPGLICPTTTLRCTAPPAAGAACVPTVEPGTGCGPDLRCVAGVCTARPGVGEPCGLGCDAALSCVSGTCVMDAALGERCDPSSAAAPACADGTYCDSTRICRATLADGEFCNDVWECEGGFCVEHVCTGLPTEGERCLDRLCGPLLTCSVADVCIAGEGVGCSRPCGIGLLCSGRFECGW